MKCSFCTGIVPEGRGKMFVKKSGQVFYFCNSKCEKNFMLGREGKKVKWTPAFKKLKEKPSK